MSDSIGFRRAALHLGALWALAFAQPLFDLLGRNAQFFVARGSTAGDILLLAFGYTLVPPLAWAPGSCGGWAGSGRRSGGRRMLVLVALIVAALLLPPAGDAARRLGGRDTRGAASWAPARLRCTRAPPASGRSSPCCPPRR